jgi:lysophospholipase L1-like esterase
MDIAFFGDSLTEGISGTSFLSILEELLPGHTLHNYGRGGDTVISLYRRIGRLRPESRFDISFLWIGVNDILATQSLTYPLLKRLRRQPWARSDTQFRHYYRKSLDQLSRHSGFVFSIPPLLIGEDLSGHWNRRLDHLTAIIEEISGSSDRADFLDIRLDIFPLLPDNGGPGYVPKSAFRILMNNRASRSAREREEKNGSEKFFLTVDGIHLNVRGAQIVADRFFCEIKKIFGPG